jgi:2-oxo-4-hydroxy-4-carboxy-5-ureidoimidazoline decarboxylase
VTVEELDRLPADSAAHQLEACCGSARWVAAMVARRPFGTEQAAHRAAKEIWSGLGPADWKEAFAHHPRIGERDGAHPQGSRGRAWSAQEQAGVRTADPGLAERIRQVNREYEARFGFIYIVCATGLGPAELLARARARLGNHPATELEVAAAEQLKITLLRLDRLLRRGD